VLREFLRARSVEGPAGSIQLVRSVLTAFRRIPYENLTKIIAFDERPGGALRRADELLRDHLERGAGGTCFSIVNAMFEALQVCGFEPRRMLGDRSYGEDMHAALSVTVRGEEWLLDPGYLVFEPVPFPEGEVAAPGGRMQWRSTPRGVEAATVFANGHRKIRYTLKPQSVTRGRFLEAWRRSFDLEMMGYPVMTCVDARGRHVYVRGPHYMVDGRFVRRLGPEEVVGVASEQGIAPDITRRAISIVGL
jgi:arylamine N-acetyltransferase